MAPSLYYLAHGRRCAASTSGSTGNSSASLLPRSSPSLGSSAEERTVAELAECALIEKFWTDETTASPSERDVKRLRVGRGDYKAHQTLLRKLDSGDGREDQPVVGGATAVAPRATYTTTSAAERAITTAAAH
jgi:hypothetical protein